MQLEIAVIIQNQASSIRCEILSLRSNQLTASCNAINPFVDFLSEIKKKVNSYVENFPSVRPFISDFLSGNQLFFLNSYEI